MWCVFCVLRVVLPVFGLSSLDVAGCVPRVCAVYVCAGCNVCVCVCVRVCACVRVFVMCSYSLSVSFHCEIVSSLCIHVLSVPN